MLKFSRIVQLFAVAGFAWSCVETEETPASTVSAVSVPASDIGSGGAIRGTVSFDGDDVPAARAIKMGSEPSCARTHATAAMTEFVIVGDGGGLKNVFVYVKEGLEGQTFPVPEEPVVLEQIGCIYIPHVFGVRVGQTVRFYNGDDTLHNIHATPKLNKEFNIGQPIKGMKTDRTLDVAEFMVPLKCEVHRWMHAYFGVVDHPFFAVTDIDGQFDLSGLPPGDYVVEAWHEKYGAKQLNVSLGEETQSISFSFGLEKGELE